jgi:hypothetical protein
MFKRAAYVRKTVPLTPAVGHGRYAESAAVVRAVPKELVKAKPGKRAPTVVEKDWIERCVRFGCVACWLDGNQPRPTAYHHIVDGGRRLGHLFGFGLCDPGHHQGGRPLGLISRHPFKGQFESKYGSEFNMLAMMKVKLRVYDEALYAVAAMREVAK